MTSNLNTREELDKLYNEVLILQAKAKAFERVLKLGRCTVDWEDGKPVVNYTAFIGAKA